MNPSRNLGPATAQGNVPEEPRGKAGEPIAIGIALRNQGFDQVQSDTTFEVHYSIGDLARQWRLGRETVRLLVKDEPGVLKIRMGLHKAITRYSVPESVAQRVHTKLFYPAPK